MVAEEIVAGVRHGFDMAGGRRGSFDAMNEGYGHGVVVVPVEEGVGRRRRNGGSRSIGRSEGRRGMKLVVVLVTGGRQMHHGHSHDELVGAIGEGRPHVVQRAFDLLQLLRRQAIDVGVPDEACVAAFLALLMLLQLLVALRLDLDLLDELLVLRVKLLKGGFQMFVGTGRNMGGRIPEAVDDGIDCGVAVGEGLAGRGESDDGDLRPTEDAELSGLLYEPVPSLGEADLASLLACYPLDLYLLSTQF